MRSRCTKVTASELREKKSTKIFCVRKSHTIFAATRDEFAPHHGVPLPIRIRLIPTLGPTAYVWDVEDSSDPASIPCIYNESCEIFAGA